MADGDRDRSRSRSRGRDADAPAEGSSGHENSDLRVYVGNLKFETNDNDLKELFAKYGEVLKAEVVCFRDNPGKSKGFGFVTFATAESAADSVKGLNETEFQGRRIRVDLTSNKKEGEGRKRFDDRGRRGGYDDRGRGGYGDRRGGYDDRRGGYGDRRGGYDDRRGGYDDRRGGYDDRRGGYDDRRGGYDDRRGGYDDRGRGGFAPRGGGGGGSRACFDFQKGNCKYGSTCKYSHDSASAGPENYDAGYSKY